MKTIIYICSIVFLLTSLNACRDYLDQVPDEKLSEENLFKSKDDVVKVLTQIYSAYHDVIDFTAYPGQASDELDHNWSNYGPYYKDNGQFGPGTPIFNNWAKYYAAIRTSIYFLDRLDECRDEKMTDQDRTWWRGEAEFLLGYYYFLLFTQYGPVPLVTQNYKGQSLDAIMEAGFPRTPADSIIRYIDRLLVSAASRLDTTFATPDRVGRANGTAAWLLRSRLALYAASPLYNGQVSPTNQKTYTHLVTTNAIGENLLNNKFESERWKKAMDIALEAIKIADKGGFGLYKGTVNGYDSYKKIFTYPRGGFPNIEFIFYKQNNSATDRGITHSLPVSWSGYSGVCPVMSHVNEYFMANGLMPEDDPEYAQASGFSVYDKDGFTINQYKKFMKRDPRFYANILYPERYSYAMLSGTQEDYNTKWGGDTDNKILYFRPYAHSQDGFFSKTGRDYTSTGFLMAKFFSQTMTKQAKGDNASPNFRYTELLLNYVEAAIEYYDAKGEQASSHAEIFTQWDRIRARVGVAGVVEAYGKAGIPLTNKKLRELIRRERRIELAFEGHRYFDNRRWLDAEREGGPKYAFNIMKDKDDGFWDEYVFETRYWDTNDKLYFMPIPQSEIDKNSKMTQNPGW